MSPEGTIVERIERLPLTVKAVELLPRGLDVGAWTRLTTVVRLAGAGAEGRGEDVCYEADDQRAFRAAGLSLPVSGATTVGALLGALDGIDLFPRPPRHDASRRYRRWAIESAAVDLALRQTGRSLADLAEQEPAPVCFVASPSLGTPPSLDPLRATLAAAGDVELKLDVTPAWSDEGLLRELAATGRVRVVDFKGAYRGTPVDGQASADLHRTVAEVFPGAWLEDPVWSAEVRSALDGHLGRVSWDAPIHDAADLERAPIAPGAVNVKPSRCGSWRALLDVIEWCRRHDVPMYGGGQFELDVGRGQIQYLASLFYPAGPNDVAPRAFHRRPVPDRLPTSPLGPPPDAAGFRFDDGEEEP